MTPTVILAGGKAKPDLVAVTGQTNRAMVVVNGRTLLACVADAIAAAGSDGEPLGPITVIGDVPQSSVYDCLPDSGDFVANIFAGLGAYPDAPYVLISTADLPFLTAASVADFVQGATEIAERDRAGIVMPIIPVESCYARYPGVKRTALRVAEGHYTTGNLALIRPEFLLANRQRIAGGYASRKSPLALARMLGSGTILRLLLSQKISPRYLTIPLLEARVGTLLGGTARAYLCSYPEIATDLDRPSDFAALGIGTIAQPS